MKATIGRLAVGLAVATCVAPSTSHAAAPGPCSIDRSTCLRVAVPLDRSNGVGGMLKLRVQVIRATRPARPPIFVFAANPGASNVREHFARDPFGAQTHGIDAWISDERRRDVVLMDLRGTGDSGAIRCDGLQRRGLAAGAVGASRCAASLGPSAAHYAVDDLVADIEAVRLRLGMPQIALFGDRFGALVAMAYARNYTNRVERMLLQSPPGPGLFDPLQRSGMRRATDLLRNLCPPRGCKGVTRDPLGDVARLTARMADGPLVGTRIGPDGRRRRAHVDGFDLFTMLASGGANPFGLAELPGSVIAASSGDVAPLLRSAGWSPFGKSLGVPPTKLSMGAAVAQLCQSAELPWPVETGQAERAAIASAYVRGLPPTSFGVFGPAAARRSDYLEVCRGWPAAGRGIDARSQLPDVPTLLIAGDRSMLGTVEDVRAVAGELPQAYMLVLDGHWEAPLFDDPSACLGAVLDSFWDGRPLEDPLCPGTFISVSPLAPPPRALGAVKPAGGRRGVAGRTLNAVRLTVRDGLWSVIRRSYAAERRTYRIGGLRRGRYVFTTPGRGRDRRTVLRMHGASLVPGVTVTGSLTFGGSPSMRGRFVVRGRAAAHGVLELRGEALRGDLGARTVAGRLPVDFLIDFGVSNGY